MNRIKIVNKWLKTNKTQKWCFSSKENPSPLLLHHSKTIINHLNLQSNFRYLFSFPSPLTDYPPCHYMFPKYPIHFSVTMIILKTMCSMSVFPQLFIPCGQELGVSVLHCEFSTYLCAWCMAGTQWMFGD